MYDSESGLYYLQSRYYDPELGRFLNADAFVSTGQGLLGNNMFAYCNNNPTMYMDDSGTAAKFIKPLGNGVSREKEALDRMRDHGLTLYKDASLTQASSGRSAFTFGYIFMGAGADENLLKHEYGHIIQSRELGVYGYTLFIVVPSVIGYGIDSIGLLPDNMYYSLPWEFKADEYGGASHKYQSWAKTVSDIYWTYAKVMSNSIF